MTNFSAKKRIEYIANWTRKYGNIALTIEDLEALDRAILVLGATQGFLALVEDEEVTNP